MDAWGDKGTRDDKKKRHLIARVPLIYVITREVTSSPLSSPQQLRALLRACNACSDR